MPFTVLKQNSTGPYEDILATFSFLKLISNIFKNYVAITMKIGLSFHSSTIHFNFFLKIRKSEKIENFIIILHISILIILQC